MRTKQSNEARQLSRGLLHHVAAPSLGGGRLALDGQASSPGAGQQTAAPDLDDAVFAKAQEVRRLLLEARETGKTWSALSDAQHEALGPRPIDLDLKAVDDACVKVLASFDHTTCRDPSICGLLAMKAKRHELHALHKRKLADWDAGAKAHAARIGLDMAEARDEAALAAASEAMTELGAMPVRTLRGIVAKASVFHPPFAFRPDDDSEHLDFAIAILRDLGCAIGGEDDGSGASSQSRARLERLDMDDASIAPGADNGGSHRAVLSGTAARALADGGAKPPRPASPWRELASMGPAGAAAADPLLRIFAEVTTKRLAIDEEDLPDDVSDAFFDRCCELDERASKTQPISLAGATASLRWARLELVTYYLGEGDDDGGRLILGLMDGATRLLERLDADGGTAVDRRGAPACLAAKGRGKRGKVLQNLASPPLATVVAALAAPTVGALPRLYAEVRDRRAAFGELSDEAFDASSERCRVIEQEALAAPAATLYDALAALSWARDELVDDLGPGPDSVEARFVDKALGVLRRVAEGPGVRAAVPR